MIVSDFLYNPIMQTDVMKDDDFTKYVDITTRQVGPTDPALVQKIRDQFVAFSSGMGPGPVAKNHITEDQFGVIWGFIEPKIMRNEGLAQFILDCDGARSEYFFPWLINVYRSPSAALEMAYGAGHDLDGVWCENIESTDDPIVYFIENDPTFVFNRERELFIANLVARYHHLGEEQGYIPKVIDFGAGRLAWARWHGLDLDKVPIYLYAFDKDPSINPEDLFESPLEEIGVHYKHGDIIAQLKNSDCRNSDIAIIAGLISYLPRDMFMYGVLGQIHQFLNPEGSFFFDLQLDCPYLQRSMKLWDWPEINLQKSVADAVEYLETIRRTVWRDGIKFSAEYSIDTYNRTPSAIMVTMTKVS